MTNQLAASAKGKVVEVAALIVIVVSSVVILKTLDFIFIPFCISLMICYALGIPISYLERFKIPGYLRIALVLLFVFLCFYFLAGLLKSNVNQFQAHLPEFEQQFGRYASLLLAKFEVSQARLDELFRNVLQSAGQADLKPVGTFVRYLGDALFTFIGNIIWILLFMAFILLEKESIARRLVRGVGERAAAPTLASAERINKAVQHYLGLKTLISAITGGLVFVIAWFFGVYFALLWGVLAFVFNFIPNIGSMIATIPPVAITLFQTASIPKAFGVAVCLVLVQVVVGNVLEPKIMGKGLDLSPLIVLLSLIFWGWMWGIMGMLLSVPLTAAIKIALEQIDATRPAAILMSGK